MLLKAILLGLIAMIGNSSFLLGTNLLDRPIITCALTGLVMGDLQTGIIIGAMMELAFIGAFAVGGALPPEMISGGILGTALTIASGNNPEVALTIGLPVASLALLLKNACMIVILPYFVHRADEFAAKGDSKGVARMHFLGGLLHFTLPLGIFVTFAFYLGNSVMQTVLNAIPEFVKTGLTIATGLMPALGFAVLASIIITKKNAVFLFLGFLISVYLGIPVKGVALFGVVTALVLLSVQAKQENETADENVEAELAEKTVAAGQQSLTKKDLMKVFWRSFTHEWTWNYERQGNLGFGFAMIPVIEKLYKDRPEEKRAALQRHLEFFNTTPHVVTLILGISSAMEEQNVSTEDFDTSSINSVKAGLMGPLAGIGDSLLWGTLRIIATGIGTSLAIQGNIMGPILFFLVFNIPHVIIRYICMMGGYKFGAGFLAKVQQNGLLDNVTHGAGIVGLMSIGAMIANMVVVNIPFSYESNGASIVLSDILNSIMPGLLPLAFTGFIFWLVTKKHFKTTWILILIVIIGILGSLTGILGI